MNPTAQRWELAAQLRVLRVAAGMSMEDAAAELLCSVAKISRMETAGRGVRLRDVRDLSRLYRIPDDVAGVLMQLAVEAGKPDWWQAFDSIDEVVGRFIGLESAASQCRVFESLLMPGLLQTPEYSRTLISQLRPELTTTVIEETVTVRGVRQKRIASGELTLHAIIDEAAVRRRVGDAGVMVAQVERLLTDAQRPNVTLQVVPFARGPHPGLEGSFEHLSFSGGLIGDVVYVEGPLGDSLLDKVEEVGRFLRVFADLAGRVALSPDDTFVRLQAVAKEWSLQMN